MTHSSIKTAQKQSRNVCVQMALSVSLFFGLEEEDEAEAPNKTESVDQHATKATESLTAAAQKQFVMAKQRACNPVVAALYGRLLF